MHHILIRRRMIGYLIGFTLAYIYCSRALGVWNWLAIFCLVVLYGMFVLSFFHRKDRDSVKTQIHEKNDDTVA
jgi:hypothetical protein